MSKRKKALLIALSSMLAVIAVIFIWAGMYVSDYYRADDEAIAAFLEDKGKPYIADDGSIRSVPSDPKAGLIFYPGGKVDHSAYAPLMQELAENGILTVIVKMPFNLAVLDINAADGIKEEYPNIDKWYIGGHSLGGSMAASYLADNPDEFCGLILLAAYSTANLTDSGVSVLSVYGSEDGVLSRDKYEENKANLPEGYIETVIEGGSHAYFGMYGEQDGDGIATISREEQIEKTAEAVLTYVLGSY